MSSIRAGPAWEGWLRLRPRLTTKKVVAGMYEDLGLSLPGLFGVSPERFWGPVKLGLKAGRVVAAVAHLGFSEYCLMRALAGDLFRFDFELSDHPEP
jgi:hypothetical protein